MLWIGGWGGEEGWGTSGGLSKVGPPPSPPLQKKPTTYRAAHATSTAAVDVINPAECLLGGRIVEDPEVLLSPLFLFLFLLFLPFLSLSLFCPSSSSSSSFSCLYSLYLSLSLLVAWPWTSGNGEIKNTRKEKKKDD